MSNNEIVGRIVASDQIRGNITPSVEIIGRIAPISPITGSNEPPVQIVGKIESAPNITVKISGVYEAPDLISYSILEEGKADKATTYTKIEVDAKDALKADKTTIYTKAQVDAKNDLKADKATTYERIVVDSKLDFKADKAYVDLEIAKKSDREYIDQQDALKASITYVDAQDALKADKANVYTKADIDNQATLLPQKISVEVQNQIAEVGVYRVEVFSTGGIIFKNEDVTTTLIARVYKNNVDVTNDINAARFRWTKILADGTPDVAWNEANFGGTKQVSITSEDLYRRASFFCDILQE